MRESWFETGLEHGNPGHNTRFRVNAPEVVLDPRFMYRDEPRGNGMMLIPIEEDLARLDGAELYLELWGGHPGSGEKRVTLNGRSTYRLPDVGGADSCTHLYPTVPLKLTDLVDGWNAVQFAVDQGTTFWGHFIVDGACLRTVLKPDHADLASAGLAGFEARVEAVPAGESIRLALRLTGDASRVASVDYFGLYEGFAENGAASARGWHGFTKSRRPVGHLGSATAPPWRVDWDTSMLPAQRDMAVRARVRFREPGALVYETPVSAGLATGERHGATVTLVACRDLPRPFWSRDGERRACTLALDADPSTIERAALHVVVWDGGRGATADPLTLNGRPLSVTAGGEHDVLYSVVPVDPGLLHPGPNRVELLSDTEHHGVEVLLPGPVLAVRTRSAATVVHAPAARPRFSVPLAVDATAAPEGGPAEVAIDFVALLSQLGEAGTFDPHSLRARAGGRPVPFQFDEEAPGRGTLVLLVPRGRRVVDVGFDTRSDRPLPAVDAAAGLSDDRRVRVEDVPDWAGQRAWRVVTPAARYVLHREGAGLASLLDADGRDWLSYRPGGGPAGEYRGLPNLGPFAHPGYAAREGEARGSTSRLVSRGPLRATVLAERHGGGYRIRYDFFPGILRVTVLEAARPYWFLYEGTPGGRLDLERGFQVASPGRRRPLAEEWHGDLPDPEWVYFGNRGERRVLFLAAHEGDDATDQYWPMEGQMTVFGFGREFRCCGRYLEGRRRFTVGLVESEAPSVVAGAIRRALAEPRIDVGRPHRVRVKEDER